MSDFSVSPAFDGRRLTKESLLDGQGLKELIIAGMTWLKTNQQLVGYLKVTKKLKKMSHLILDFIFMIFLLLEFMAVPKKQSIAQPAPKAHI